LALLVGSPPWRQYHKRNGGDVTPKSDRLASEAAPWLVPKLLSLAFIVSAGIGVFEGGLALRGKQELELTQYQIGVM